MPQGIKNPLWFGLPDRLLRLRCDADLGQQQLAALAGCSSPLVSLTENGHSTPAADTVERLALALGVSPAWLAFGHEAEHPFRQRRPRPPIPPTDPTPQPAKAPVVSATLHLGLAKRLRAARDVRTMSMRQLANAAGVSAQSVMMTEAGNTIPKVSTCERLAQALDVAPGWLAYGLGEEPMP